MRTRTALILMCAMLALPGSVPAQTEPLPENKELQERYMFQWTDSKGDVHISDRLEKVPQKYRKNAQAIKEPGSENSEPPAAKPSRTTPSDIEFEQELQRDEWKQRYQDWKDRLRALEKQCNALEQKRTNLIGRWGSPAAAPLDVRNELDLVEKDLQNAREQLDEARTMINSVLPDEARKAGIPPGWLRE